MRITIAERLRPFSHLSGVSLVLPGTTLVCEVFPTRVVIQGKGVITFDLKAPIDDFTVCQDLERGCIRVWGQADSGYFEYNLVALQDGSVRFIVERLKALRLEVRWSSDGLWKVWQAGVDSTDITIALDRKQYVEFGTEGSASTAAMFEPIVNERLSLGSHKLQEWCGVSRRCNFAEIFPQWLRLGQLTPAQPESMGTGTTHLLRCCEQQRTRDEILPTFESLYRAGFEGLLVPRLRDTHYQGYDLPEPSVDESPFSLLTEGAQVIRQLFIQHDDRTVSFLPHLPPEFHCGRFLNVSCREGGSCDFEWSKKTFRRGLFRSEQSGEWNFRFPDDVKQFRLRFDRRDPGRQVIVGTPLQLLAGKHYLFDNFMH